MTDKWRALGRDRRDKIGTPYRQQRNVYAMRVTLQLTGGEYRCPCCGVDFDMSNAQAYDVDKVIPSLDYVPNNVVYICRTCNATRGELQRIGKDWRRVSDYARDVRQASALVSVPALGKETREEWQALIAQRPTGSRSKYA